MVPRLSYTIWFSQRTGSSLLTNALGETWVAGHPEEWLETWGGPSLLDRYGVATGAELLAELRKQGATENGVWGAKVSFHEPRHAEVISLLREGLGLGSDVSRPQVWEAAFPNHQHIVMTRRNKVRLAVSWWRAITCGRWHLRADDSPAPALPAQNPDDGYDFAAISRLVTESVMREAGIAAFLSEAGIVPLTLVYEDFILDYEGTLRRVLDLLGVEADVPPPALLPTADAVSEAWVQRFRAETQAGWPHRGW